MNKLIVRAALISCAAVAVTPVLASHSWGNYHWGRINNPLKLNVVDGVTPSWDAYLDEAISDWQIPNLLALTEEAGGSVNAKKCTAIPGKVLVCNAAYGPRGWLGIATIWASGNHITQATTKLNDSYFSTGTYNTPGWRRMVTCQEIGHDFGLGHQDEGFGPPNIGTCMDYTNDPDGDLDVGGPYGPSNEHPDDHDYSQLATIYGHTTDTSNTSATQTTNFGVRVPGQAPAAPSGLNNEPGDGPAEWGRAAGTDGLGRPNLYVQDLGGGRKKITHVFWAIGEGPKGRHHDEH